MLTTIKIYACYAVKNYSNFFQTGGARARCAGTESAFGTT